MKLVLAYSGFAVVAMLANFLAQHLVALISPDAFRVWVELVVGTGVGLVVKFVLDKKYIFRHQSKSAGNNLKLLALYSFFGLATTAIFWAGELGFQFLFHTDLMKYLGAAIGLAVGYVCKYQLDKHLVFGKAKNLE